MEVDYEKRRIALVTYAESVRHAQQVQVDDIPLPTLQLPADPSILFMGLPSQIPLPADPVVGLVAPHLVGLAGVPLPPGLALPPPPSILKKTSAYTGAGLLPKLKKNPGVPPGPPPEISDVSDEEPMEQSGKTFC